MNDDLPLLSAIRLSLSRVRTGLGVGADRALGCVVAVSGGEDSHVLLHALAALRGTAPDGRTSAADAPLALTVAHFDHALRLESRQEAEFVRGLAERYRLPFVSARASEGPSRGENVEAWARETRYRFLEEARIGAAAHVVVTAHHRNDQAETVLFRLVTGRFPQRGLGMPEFDEVRCVLRPLLSLPKSAIEDYGIVNRLDFVSDPSNSDRQRTRNQLRHELLPMLERDYNPQIVAALCLLAERYERDESYIGDAAAAARSTLEPAVPCRSLLAMPDALRLRVLGILAYEQVGAAGESLGMRDLLAVSRLVEEARPARRTVHLGGGVECAVSRDEGVCFSVPEGRSLPRAAGPQELPIPGFVERRYPDGSEATIRAGIVVVKDDIRENPDRMIEWIQRRELDRHNLAHAVEYFDLEQLPSACLMIRERRLGDRIRVFSRGERKLKKLFLERGVARSRRDSVPVIESGTNILWVPGVARSDLAPVGLSSRFLLELRFNRCSAGAPGARALLREIND